MEPHKPENIVPPTMSSAGKSAGEASDIAELQREIAGLHRELRLLRMANAELERVAILDTLTPLHNRRFFLGALNDRILRRTRYQSQAAVLFIDINRMKFINDAYGHAAGDFALVYAAQIIAAQIRSTDVAARIGGDEFALILEEADEVQARLKADQLDELLRESRCAYGDILLPVSASIGVTIIRENDREDAVIERADADMYARKREWHVRTGHAPDQRSDR
ncbi:GGDEF domain-containing protein [Sphingobium subterraneum]|nr:GGDEF domain-containing protein [Sphingobium subterraneum]